MGFGLYAWHERDGGPHRPHRCSVVQPPPPFSAASPSPSMSLLFRPASIGAAASGGTRVGWQTRRSLRTVDGQHLAAHQLGPSGHRLLALQARLQEPLHEALGLACRPGSLHPHYTAAACCGKGRGGMRSGCEPCSSRGSRPAAATATGTAALQRGRRRGIALAQQRGHWTYAGRVKEQLERAAAVLLLLGPCAWCARGKGGGCLAAPWPRGWRRVLLAGAAQRIVQGVEAEEPGLPPAIEDEV